MNLCIGNKITEFRKEQSKTQEQLANYVGVSVAAVSKWETKQSYPDITLLPSIADFFGVSIDALLGYKVTGCNEIRENIYKNIFEADINGDYKTAIPIINDALNKYPNDFNLLRSMGSMLRMRAWESEMKEQDFKDAIMYYERALKCAENEDNKLWMKVSISQTYDSMGDTKKALDLMLEINASKAFDADIARIKYKLGEKQDAKIVLQSQLWGMAFNFWGIAGRLAVWFADEGNHEMALEAQKLHAQFLSAFTNDTPNYADTLCASSYSAVAKYCSVLNMQDEMWENLSRAVYHAIRFDENPSYKTRSIKFMDGMPERAGMGNNSPNLACNGLLMEIKQDFAEFASNEKFVQLRSQLESAKQTKQDVGVWA
ncbi:MAG: helix-turn-helix domain-containing protein [Firmicutes bacterium]|nr:helix-turn-helix domain-containing protein [Bacillota bacterium]